MRNFFTIYGILLWAILATIGVGVQFHKIEAMHKNYDHLMYRCQQALDVQLDLRAKLEEKEGKRTSSNFPKYPPIITLPVTKDKIFDKNRPLPGHLPINDNTRPTYKNL